MRIRLPDAFFPWLCSCAALAVAGCGGQAQTVLHVKLAAERGGSTATDGQAAGSQGAPSADLRGARTIHVTVTQVTVQTGCPQDQNDQHEGERCQGGDMERGNGLGGGHRHGDRGHGACETSRGMLAEPRAVDLAGGMEPSSLGEVVVDSASQARVFMKLRTDGPAAGGGALILHAVTDGNGQICDLLVPEAAAGAGLGMHDVAAAGQGRSGGEVTWTLRLDLARSARVELESGCAFSLSAGSGAVHVSER